MERGYFAESGRLGFRHEKIISHGITRFTLMNADSDQPLRQEPLTDGETISLSALSTANINIRADYEGEPPSMVQISLNRLDEGPTGLPAHASQAHEHPPYFVAGDYWADGRPEDCHAWIPRPGRYRLRAEAFYTDTRRGNPGKPLQIDFTIAE